MLGVVSSAARALPLFHDQIVFRINLTLGLLLTWVPCTLYKISFFPREVTFSLHFNLNLSFQPRLTRSLGLLQ
ncbi:hypothetical protein BHE90_014110 [Fusarium euwallaceae]|uniref:Uncharacterized protein n=3 Tax=Fusarium solani species complex TaxID=232080 RepID=A0A430L6V6_9HYPO|nr:hypothetical protein CEP51_005930 [Fusarium floridanum]RSM17398.1 hypothetical protein CDV31_003814 [Fusarium ambrosium]RTE71477.1 hypothetical protein BHE90_014110 [Fusarium euwallaceae]